MREAVDNLQRAVRRRRRVPIIVQRARRRRDAVLVEVLGDEEFSPDKADVALGERARAWLSEAGTALWTTTGVGKRMMTFSPLISALWITWSNDLRSFGHTVVMIVC